MQVKIDYVGKDYDYVGKDSNEVPLECKPKALKIREVRILYCNKISNVRIT